MKPIKPSSAITSVRSLVLLFTVVISGTLPAAEPAAAHALAGWSEVDITPPLGIALGGRGGPDATADQVLDPLLGQVLLLKDPSGRGLVVVSLDLVGLQQDTSDRIRTRIAAELGVEHNLVVLNCSHTHSGPLMYRDLFAGLEGPPPMETKYLATLTEQIVLAAKRAQQQLKAVHVKVYNGPSDVGINRRGKNKQGNPGILPNPDGPTDTNVWILNLGPLNKDPGAVIFAYGCHPVLVYGFAHSAISADFPGAARTVLRQELGTATHVQFIQALGGNIRPRVNADLEKRSWRRGTMADVRRAGADLAEDVLEALRTKPTTLELRLAGSIDRPFLPRGEPPPRATYEKMVSSGNLFQQSVAKYWLARYDANDGFARGDSWTIGLIRLAENQWIAYLAGEPVIEWQGKIAHWLAPQNVKVWGYCQHAISYLPVEEQLSESGYEVTASNHNRATTPAPFTLGIHEAVRQSLLRQAAFIQADVK